ncbi:hypothetical protein VNI00_017687 [Paramarasmius palmivorus]|uniref:DUF6534 domain-containing protein n=1 Tax=Paramarasmius palmivorus TaxID=297713 RepID=A0AAW0B3Q8_9AGAR
MYIVQAATCRRIWALGNNQFLKGLACVITFVAFAQGTSAIVAGFIGSPNTTQQTLLRLHPAFQHTAENNNIKIWSSGSFVADVLITGSMFWILHTAKANSSFAQSDVFINRLILNTVQTGALTVVAATVDLALFTKDGVVLTVTVNPYSAYIFGKLQIYQQFDGDAQRTEIDKFWQSDWLIGR